MCTEGMQGEPFQGVKAQRDKSRRKGGRTWRLEPGHPEGQATCRAKPLGIDTARPWLIGLSLMTNAAVCTWPTSRQQNSSITPSAAPHFLPLSPSVKGGPPPPSARSSVSCLHGAGSAASVYLAVKVLCADKARLMQQVSMYRHCIRL